MFYYFGAIASYFPGGLTSASESGPLMQWLEEGHMWFGNKNRGWQHTKQMLNPLYYCYWPLTYYCLLLKETMSFKAVNLTSSSLTMKWTIYFHYSFPFWIPKDKQFSSNSPGIVFYENWSSSEEREQHYYFFMM